MKPWSHPPDAPLYVLMCVVAILFVVGILLLYSEPTIKYGP